MSKLEEALAKAGDYQRSLLSVFEHHLRVYRHQKIGLFVEYLLAHVEFEADNLVIWYNKEDDCYDIHFHEGRDLEGFAYHELTGKTFGHGETLLDALADAVLNVEEK